MVYHESMARFPVVALLFLAGCGAPISEHVDSDTTRTGMWAADEDCCTVELALRSLARRRNLPDQVWAPPLLVAERDGPDPAWLPGRSLLRLQVTVYPKMSCKGHAGPERRPPPKKFQARLERIRPDQLKALGEPAGVHEIWVSPLESTKMHRHRFGPGWFGNLVRMGGGAELYFPAYQDCGAMAESQPVSLPRRVFYEAQTLHISARSPFVVRVLEVCNAAATQREQVVVSYQVPLWTWGYSIGAKESRTRIWERFEAKCSSGQKSFEYGPRIEGSMVGKNPPLELKVSL